MVGFFRNPWSVNVGIRIFVGTSGEGIVYRSTDNGANWTAANTGLDCIGAYTFFKNKASILVGTDNGIFLSTNSGTTWTSSSIRLSASSAVWSFVPKGPALFAGTYHNGVFLSTDTGASWSAVNSGLANMDVRAIAFMGTDVFAGTASGLWRRPLSEMITSVQSSADQLPVTFALHQNFPNPFNPSTTIRYALPHRSQVTLTFYNTLGQLVSTLVNATEEAGYHQVKFDGSNLASGVYFYRLEAGSFVQTRKLLLLK